MQGADYTKSTAAGRGGAAGRCFAGVRAALFDFDGTLADTLPKICETASRVLAEHGIAPEDQGDLRRLVGPPFPEAFSMVYGVSAGEAASITEDYRAIYNHIGADAWPFYKGICGMLERLRGAGLLLGVVSSKGQNLIERGLADNRAAGFFDVVAGNRPEAPESKAETLARVLGDLAEQGFATEDCVMVGDRRFDVEAALSCGIACVGVTWGATCDRSELEEAGAAAIVDSPDELAALLLG